MMEPVTEDTDGRHDRGSFLKKLGATLAVGLGVGLVASEPALAACDGIICYPVGDWQHPCGGDPFGYCNGTLCGGQCFHCTGCDEDFYYCTTHTCTTWCFISVC
jgi:hypothetical protein